jgi:hypothetical protein
MEGIKNSHGTFRSGLDQPEKSGQNWLYILSTTQWTMSILLMRTKIGYGRLITLPMQQKCNKPLGSLLPPPPQLSPTSLQPPTLPIVSWLFHFGTKRVLRSHCLLDQWGGGGVANVRRPHSCCSLHTYFKGTVQRDFNFVFWHTTYIDRARPEYEPLLLLKFFRGPHNFR